MTSSGDQVSSFSSIPNDIMSQILFKLPRNLKTLHKLKCVSKSWFSIITNEVIPKLLTMSPHLGFYHAIYRCHGHNYYMDPLLVDPNDGYMTDHKLVDIGLPCLPHNQTDDCDCRLKIFDSSCGLVLCHAINDFGYGYYVCDPAACSWSVISLLEKPSNCISEYNDLSYGYNWRVDRDVSPLTYYIPRLKKPFSRFSQGFVDWDNIPRPNKPSHVMLDFDPIASPYFRVVSLRLINGNRFIINVHHSESHCLLMFVVNLKHFKIALVHGFDDCCDYDCAIWKGDIYLYACCMGKIGDHNQVDDVTNCEVLRISGIMGENRSVGYEILKFPIGTKKPNTLSRAYIGRWKNKLRLASLDDLQIRVWALQEKHEDEWVLEHCSVVIGLNEFTVEDPPPHIVGFHPLLNAVLILFKSFLFAYDLVEMSFDRICRIGEETDSVISASVFPYIPQFDGELLELC